MNKLLWNIEPIIYSRIAYYHALYITYLTAEILLCRDYFRALYGKADFYFTFTF